MCLWGHRLDGSAVTVFERLPETEKSAFPSVIRVLRAGRGPSIRQASDLEKEPGAAHLGPPKETTEFTQKEGYKKKLPLRWPEKHTTVYVCWRPGRQKNNSARPGPSNFEWTTSFGLEGVSRGCSVGGAGCKDFCSETAAAWNCTFGPPIT